MGYARSHKRGRVSDMLILDRAVGIATLLAVGIIIGVVIMRVSGPAHCYEDEAALWDGTAHALCVPLDDMIGEGQ